MSENFMQSEEKENKKVGKDKQKFQQSEVSLTFRYNRAFELHVGRNIYKFSGRETVKVPISTLDHPDFTENISKKFIIQ